MSAQQALALPLPAASNTVVINARCSLRVEADQRVIVVGGLPVHQIAPRMLFREFCPVSPLTSLHRLFGRFFRRPTLVYPVDLCLDAAFFAGHASGFALE